MFPGRMNPKMMRQMQKMMSDMGMDAKDIKVLKITMELEDKVIEFNKPKVQVMDIMGNKTYTITGRGKTVKKEELKEGEQKPQIEDVEVSLDITDDDIKMVMEHCNVSREVAIKTLKECDGELADAILKLTD